MARDPQAIQRFLAEMIQPDARGRLLARGLARSMVWRDGLLPEGAQEFTPTLTSDLLDFGYGILSLALELRDENRRSQSEQQFETAEALRIAAEAIESAVRNGDSQRSDQGRHLVVSATAFHLAGYAARSFSLLPAPTLQKNLSSPERALALLLRRDLDGLRQYLVTWLGNPDHQDDAIATRLQSESDPFDADDAALVSLTAAYHRALGLADTALRYGDAEAITDAIARLEQVVSWSASLGNIPTWWAATLARHLLGDLWGNSLHVRLPESPGPFPPEDWEDLRRKFIEILSARHPPHIDLWPSQLAAAARATDPSDDLVIALPTSAGKTRIAELCILRALADQKRSIYVTPLRALSAQVERVLARTFVPLGASVTSLYGASGVTLSDAETLGSADIVVATPEKLDFALRQDPDILLDVALIVLDEGHMIGLGSREIRYEVLIQRLLRRDDADQRRIVCLSAMFNPEDPDFKDFGEWLRSDAPGDFVHVRWRPTRQRTATLDWSTRTSTATLSFIEDEKPFVPRFLEQSAPIKPRRKPFPTSDIEFCIAAANGFARDGHSVLVYSPQRSQVETLAREFRHMRDQGYLDHVKAPAPAKLRKALAIGREWLGEQHSAMSALRVGVGAHHGALPRPFLNAIEELLDARELQVVIASPTLAQGIDLACSVLLFRSLRRYEERQWVPISPAEFANVVGRAGRAYVDVDGISVVPTFNPSDRRNNHALLDKLLKESKGQRLTSGLALLVWRVAKYIKEELSGSQDVLEYVVNQHDFWTSIKASSSDDGSSDDETDANIDERLADLDIAIFSLLEDLDAPVETLAATLDDVLQKSLWKRTLSHVKERTRQLERAILVSRAQWLWRKTTAQQRRACYFSGLGKAPGVFIYEHLDKLVDILATLQEAVSAGDEAGVAKATVSFCALVGKEPFFSVRSLPSDWKAILSSWVRGVAFAAILHGLGSREAQKAQAFVQDGLVFKLVWAAEAVRVQAIASDHARQTELGDGPAYALTYGVPSIPAALLCQIGYASRVGALFLARKTLAAFTDTQGLNFWLQENDVLLADEKFWDSDDHRLLWTYVSEQDTEERPRRWRRRIYKLPVEWTVTPPPPPGIRVRIVGKKPAATVCTTSLEPIGSIELPFRPMHVAVDAVVTDATEIKVKYFGEDY